MTSRKPSRTSVDDSISPLVPHADVRTPVAAVENNQLTELGQKIFLDRYALKDTTKRTLSTGDLVIVCVDAKTGQREIGIVDCDGRNGGRRRGDESPSSCTTAAKSNACPSTCRSRSKPTPSR